MSNNPYRQDKDELNELLKQYRNLKAGKSYSFIDEEGFERIMEYFDENEQFQNGLEAAGHALEIYGYSAALHLKKAAFLLSLRQYQDALDTLEHAELLDSSNSELYILKTDVYLALDKPGKAAVLLEEAIHKFEGEERIELLFELADVYDDYEEFEKVFDCLRLILQQEPTNEEALYKICFWTDYTGRNEEGIRLHQDIIDDYPYNELAWFNLGAAYQGLKLYEKAIDAYQYAVAIDEKFDYAYRNMGDAYIKLRKFREAIEVLEKVCELSRPEAVIYEAIGHCYDKLDNYAQARFYYRKASHLNPEDSQMIYKIACTYMNESNWNTAIRNLEQALKMVSMQPEYHLAIGRCYLELKRPEEAMSHFGIVVKVRPKNINGWQELLRTMYLSGLYTEGAEYASMAYDHTDGKDIFLYYRSMFLFASGRSKEALELLEKALSSSPRHVKQFIELNPAILRNASVVELLARYKKKRSK